VGRSLSAVEITAVQQAEDCQRHPVLQRAEARLRSSDIDHDHISSHQTLLIML